MNEATTGDSLKRSLRVGYVAVIAAAAVAFYGIIRYQFEFLFPVAAAIVGFAAALFGTRVALPLYFATVFGEPANVPGIPISLNQAAAGFLILAFAIELFRRPWRAAPTLALVSMVLFHAYFVTMSIVLHQPGTPFLYQPVFYLLLTIVMAGFGADDRWRSWMLWSFFLITIVGALLGFAELALRQDITFRGLRRFGHLRINGLGADAIQFAFTMLWGGFIGLYLFLSSRGFLRLMCLCGAVTLFLASLVTLNRQTPIILFAMLIVFAYLCRWRYRPLLFVGIFTVTALAVPLVGAKLAERWSTASSVTKDASLGVRYDKAITALEMVKAHPLVGVGHGNFRHLWPEYRPRGETVNLQDSWDTDIHVDLGYLQVLVEYGSIGLALYGVLVFGIGAALWRGLRIAKRIGDAELRNLFAMLCALFAQLCISMFIQDTFGIPRTNLLIGLIVASDLLARRRLAEWERTRASAP